MKLLVSDNKFDPNPYYDKAIETLGDDFVGHRFQFQNQRRIYEK